MPRPDPRPALLAALAADPGAPAHALAAEMGISRARVSHLLGDLADKGEVVRDAGGRYRVAGDEACSPEGRTPQRLSAVERRRAIVNDVAAGSAPSERTLADWYDCSPGTIQRDIAILVREGALARDRGARRSLRATGQLWRDPGERRVASHTVWDG